MPHGRLKVRIGAASNTVVFSTDRLPIVSDWPFGRCL
jgi:hypothetical protein